MSKEVETKEEETGIMGLINAVISFIVFIFMLKVLGAVLFFGYIGITLLTAG